MEISYNVNVQTQIGNVLNVLEPVLLNATYDDLLTIPVLIDIHLVELADDLAVVGVATTGSLPEELIDPELEQVDGYMDSETTTKAITLFVVSCRMVVVGVGTIGFKHHIF